MLVWCWWVLLARADSLSHICWIGRLWLVDRQRVVWGDGLHQTAGKLRDWYSNASARAASYVWCAACVNICRWLSWRSTKTAPKGKIRICDARRAIYAAACFRWCQGGRELHNQVSPNYQSRQSARWLLHSYFRPELMLPDSLRNLWEKVDSLWQSVPESRRPFVRNRVIMWSAHIRCTNTMEKPTMMTCRIFPDRNCSAQKICTGSPAYSDYKVRNLRGTTSASKEWMNGRHYPRCMGTTTLVPRAGRGAKKLFSKNEVLTRTHSFSKSRHRSCPETEGCHKRRRRYHRTCSVREGVLRKGMLL